MAAWLPATVWVTTAVELTTSAVCTVASTSSASTTPIISKMPPGFRALLPGDHGNGAFSPLASEAPSDSVGLVAWFTVGAVVGVVSVSVVETTGHQAQGHEPRTVPGQQFSCKYAYSFPFFLARVVFPDLPLVIRFQGTGPIVKRPGKIPKHVPVKAVKCPFPEPSSHHIKKDLPCGAGKSSVPCVLSVSST